MEEIAGAQRLPDTDAAIKALLGSLRAIQSRYRARLNGILALCAAFVLISVLAVAHWFGALEKEPATIILTALGSSLLLLLAGGVAATLGTPSLSRIARKADSELDLAERISSALEVAGAWPEARGSVTSALLRDTESRSGILAQYRVRPAAALISGIVLIALLLAGASLWFALKNASSNSPLPSGDTVVEAIATTPLSPEALDQVAELVAADAERLDSQYLRAVADSLAELSDEIAEGRPPADMQERLEAALEHAMAAYGAAAPDWLPADPQDLGALAAGLERQAARAFAAVNPNAVNVPLPDEWDPNSADPMRRSPEALQEYLAKSGTGASTNAMVRNAGTVDMAIGALPVLDDFEPKLLEAGEVLSGSPAGASRNADKGVSDAAGTGTQPLAPDGDFATTDFATAGEMRLTAEPGTEGNLIRVEMAPAAELSAVDGVGAVGGVVQRQQSTPVDRSASTVTERPVIARYFAQEIAAPGAVP